MWCPALFKMLRFLEGISLFSVYKKNEAEAGALYAWDVLLPLTKKKVINAGASAFYGGKCKHTILPSWQTDQPWLLIKRK